MDKIWLDLNNHSREKTIGSDHAIQLFLEHRFVEDEDEAYELGERLVKVKFFFYIFIFNFFFKFS